MLSKISVVINTLNNEGNIKRALESVKWADEILVCDMHSGDKTSGIAKEMGAKVIEGKRVEYVELARNFSISKASNDWILVLDPDEEITESLKERLLQISSKMKGIDYVRIPRKNIIFGKWMQASGWWPDLNIRFFKKGKVKWSNKIHRPPEVMGEGIDLEADERWAIIHNNYGSISDFIIRMNRYTKVEADELIKDGCKFNWKDLIEKPLSEFLSRFFANKGYLDGLHGLALSLLQAFSFLIVYLRIWERENFKQSEINFSDIEDEKKRMNQDVDYWINQTKKSKSLLKSFFQKIKTKK